MKLYALCFLAFLYSLQVIAQPRNIKQNPKSTLNGEQKYYTISANIKGNNKSGSKGYYEFPFADGIGARLVVVSGIDNDDTFAENVKILPQVDRPQPPVQGIKIQFDVKESTYLRVMRNRSVVLKIIIIFPPDNITRELTEVPSNPISISFAGAKPISPRNPTVINLNGPILFAAPEIFTLKIMNMYVEQNIQGLFSESNGFSEVIPLLNHYTENNYYNKDISYSTLLDLYKLLVFTGDYVDKNSFFIMEGNKLERRLNELSVIIRDTSNWTSYPDKRRLMPLSKGESAKEDFVEEYIKSNQVYQEYQKIYTKLKDYNSRAQLILFLKSK